MKKVRTRLLFVLGLTFLSLYVSIPSWPGLHDALPGSVKWLVPPRGVALGLDLQGGIHLVLEVEQDRAVEIAVDRTAKAMRDLLTDKGIEFSNIERKNGIQVTVELFGSDKLEKVSTLLVESFPSYSQVFKDGQVLLYELDSNDVDRIKNGAINQALETIRNRIDQFGVTEPLLQRQGKTQIIIQLPGVKDPKRAKDLIQDTALLEFKMLDEANVPKLLLPVQVERSEEEATRENFLSQVPEGSEILFEPLESDEGLPKYSRPYLVFKNPALTGDVLQDARVSIGDFSEPLVSVTFDSKGAR